MFFDAFIFILTERVKHLEVVDDILKVEVIKIAHAVTGKNDIIVYTSLLIYQG